MIRAFQWDLARQVERLDWLLRQLPRYAEWGYNELYLHLEDSVEYPSLPGIARRDAYSHRELGQLVDAAHRVGINVVPIVNLLGHTQYLIKVPELRDLNELRAADGTPLERGQVCPVHPRTLEVAAKLLRDMAPFCTAGKVHVGLDESFHLGKHPLSRREIARIGLPAHFAHYVGRLRELTRSMGLGMGMWADMLYFLPGAVDLLPNDIAAYEWYYYGFTRRPRIELFNFAETDLGERLHRRGIEYWGCPMNGAFRFEPLPHFGDRLGNILSWWRQCQKLNATGFLITSWEPNRLAMELTTVVDAAAASLWLDGVDDPRRMLERGFVRVFGPKHAKAAAQAALACDRYPFSGYPRWEINSRWDVVPRREGIGPCRAEERHYRKLGKLSTSLPPPLRSSVELRWYLAKRDVFVREAQQKRNPNDPSLRGRIAEFKAANRKALRAARAMWARTRDPNGAGPNTSIIDADLERLKAWTSGEPVFGAKWQLCYRVENFAPAAQLVVVEQRRQDGGWETRQSCHTIEFQTRAARKLGGLTREHAAPIDWDGDLSHPPEVRIAVRGAGQVRIADPLITDGSKTWRCAPNRRVVGRPAPRRGFVSLDWTVNQAVLPLRMRAAAKRARDSA